MTITPHNRWLLKEVPQTLTSAQLMCAGVRQKWAGGHPCVCVGGRGCGQLGVGGAGSWASGVDSKFSQPCSAPTHPATSADQALPGLEALGAPRDRVRLPLAVAPCAAAASLCPCVPHSTIWPLAAASPGFSHLEETNGITNLMIPSGSWIYSRKINICAL